MVDFLFCIYVLLSTCCFATFYCYVTEISNSIIFCLFSFKEWVTTRPTVFWPFAKFFSFITEKFFSSLSLIFKKIFDGILDLYKFLKQILKHFFKESSRNEMAYLIDSSYKNYR